MEGIVVIGVLAIGFLIYGIPFGITRLSLDDFFLMNRSADVKQYNDTTVAYSLQVAITVYFFYWGYSYGFANIIFIATWFLGLFLFSRAAPKLVKMAANNVTQGSLFAYLSGGRQQLRKFMGVLFATSLVGLLFTELYLTSEFVESIAMVQQAGEPLPHFYFWLSFGVLAFVILWYCSLGGMKKVVETDTWQLSIAYLGSSVFFASLAPSIADHGGKEAFYLVYIAVPLLYLVMAFMPSLMTSLLIKEQSISLKNTTFFTFISLIFSSMVASFPLLIFKPTHLVFPGKFPAPFDSMLQAPYGWVPIIGFTLINAIWQFSDYTAYHRLSLLKLPEDEQLRVKRIKESIYVTMFNSPLTWGIGIFAGMAVQASGLLAQNTTEVFTSFVKVAADGANKGDHWLQYSLIGLAAFVGSVMMSTVDSGFMSVAQIVVRDILQAPLERFARFLVNVFIIILMLAFALMLVEFDIHILVFVNATYSWGLVFGALALATLYKDRVPTIIAFLALTLGAIGGAIGTFNLGLPDLVALVVRFIKIFTIYTKSRLNFFHLNTTG